MTGWIAAAALLLAAVVVAVDRYRTARIMARLDRMVTQAMDGDFTESDFDETRLSALEARMARYLAASALSARNLRQQKEQIAALISDISHQTKTPVANLRLYAQLLAEQPLSPQGRDCAAAIDAQSEKLETLIQALVKSSRLETGILTLHPVAGDLAPMVERAAAQYGPRAGEKGVTLTVGETAGDAVFDAKWTEEAVCNLLDNAVKYTPSGGTVTVSVRSLGAQHTAVSYDGVAVGDCQSGQVDISRFSLDNVSALTLTIGQGDDIFQPAKALASAGVLSIETGKPDFGAASFRLAARVKSGSFGLANPSLFWAVRLGGKAGLSF